jgi:hypothetical protein
MARNCWIGCAPIPAHRNTGIALQEAAAYGYFSGNLNPQQDVDPVEFDTAGIAHPEASRTPGTVTVNFVEGCHLYIALTGRRRV